MEIDQTKIQGPFRSNIGHANAMAPIDTTAHSPELKQVPELTQVQEPVIDAQCTSWSLGRRNGRRQGRWDGPTTRDVGDDQLSVVSALW